MEQPRPPRRKNSAPPPHLGNKPFPSPTSKAFNLTVQERPAPNSEPKPKSKNPGPKHAATYSEPTTWYPLPRRRPTQKPQMAAFISYIRIPVAITSALAASLSGLLYWKQNELIYPRNVPPGSRTDVPRAHDFPEYELTDKTEELSIPTADGEHLSAFLIKASRNATVPVDPEKRKLLAGRDPGSVTMIMFHGNAGNIGHRLPIAGVLAMNLGCNILMLEYRGYGLSSGVPDEKGLNMDAQAGLDFVRSRDDLKDTRVVLFGQSLGGAVAIQLALRNLHVGDIKALVLENTFLSIKKLIPHALPPAKYLTALCHQFWTSEDDLPKITGIPMLFLSGLGDEIVPAAHMKRLHAISNADPKILRVFPTGTHNDTVACPGYFDAIEFFVKSYVLDAR